MEIGCNHYPHFIKEKVFFRVPLFVNSKTGLTLSLTPKPQNCPLESNLPGLSLHILLATCNWSEIQEKRAFDFVCTIVTCFVSDIAKTFVFAPDIIARAVNQSTSGLDFPLINMRLSSLDCWKTLTLNFPCRFLYFLSSFSPSPLPISPSTTDCVPSSYGSFLHSQSLGQNKNLFKYSLLLREDSGIPLFTVLITIGLHLASPREHCLDASPSYACSVFFPNP